MPREFKEEVEIVPLLEQQVRSTPKDEEEEAEESPQVHKSVFSDPTRDVLIRGRGREIGVPISASLGAIRPLLGKLEMLLQAPPLQGCSNAKRIERVKDGMRLLKDDVEKMSSYLDQLSEVEDPPPTANCWMNEARDLSYDMEDFMDSLIFVRPQDASLVPNNIKITRSRLKFRSRFKFFSHPKTAKTPKSKVDIIAETLSEFRKYVQEAIERHHTYNLHSCSFLRRRFVSLGPMLPTPMQYQDIVIDGRMNGFINSLANDGDQQLKVLSVLGHACLGKTTLARVLYNRLGKQYHCRAFIRVSKKPDMKRIFRGMLAQLQRQHSPQDCKEADLIDNIKKYLQDKRYLIIIDDLWATSVWDIINHVFPKGSQGSRIVTTTQIEDIALTCCSYQSEHVFQMKPLNDDHSRKLFFTRLFGSENDCPEELKEVSNRIVEICDGLPLATISIACLLASQSVISIDILMHTYQSLSSCFSANSTSERMRQVLSLSYNNLPDHLKTCLLYLSMYQEGYTFYKDDLLKQWMAEGLIGTTEGQDIEKVAESYLDQLIGRRFIQPIRVNYNNEVLSCQVHDMVHDLIAHKSVEDNFIVAMNYSCRKNVSLSFKARRLSLIFGDARYAKTPANIRKSQVRSFRFSGLLESMPCLTEFKLVRVLNLQLSGQGRRDDDTTDLTGISELFQLRYLKIACDVCIKLPNHVLQCLGTLDITDARFAPVPWDVNFPRLLHLHLSLPVERDLLDWIDRTKSPSLMSLGKLNYLQELHLTISSLSTFQHVVKNMEALGCLLGGHGNLKTIAVAHASPVKNITASKTDILWDCMEPPPLLQRFEFSPHSSCIFSRVPLWVGKLGNLRILKIAVRGLPTHCADILRGLPTLTALSLYVETPPDDKIIFDKAGFSVLKYFKFTFVRGIAWVKFEADAMPNLWKLKLVFNAIPQMDQRSFHCSNYPQLKQYRHGTALISIDYMPGLREISAKFGGAAADLEYVSRIGVVSNHPSNPIIDVQLVDSGSYGDESIKKKQEPDEILEGKPEEYEKALETPADKRSPESSLHLHVSGKPQRNNRHGLSLPFRGGVCPVKPSENHGGEHKESDTDCSGGETTEDPRVVPAKCAIGDSNTFKLGSLSCTVCQALLHNTSKCKPCSHKFCKACISRFKDCPLCGAYIEEIEPDAELQALVDRFIEHYARFKGSLAGESEEAADGKSEVIYEDVSMERGAFLVQQAMRAFRAQNIESAKLRLSMCAEDHREELKSSEGNLDLRSQLGAVLGMLGDCCRALGDAPSAITYYEESAEFLSKLPTKDLELVHALSVSLNKIGDLRYYDGDLQSARSYYARSLDVRRNSVKEHSAVPSQVIDLATSLAKVADVDRNLGKEDAAIEGFKEAIQCLEKLKLDSEQVSLKQLRRSVLDFVQNQLDAK